MVVKMDIFKMVFILETFLWIQAELLTPMPDSEAFLKTHEIVAEDLKKQISKEEEKIDILKSYLKTFERENIRIKENSESYLGNPMNVFKLMKRLEIDAFNTMEFWRSISGSSIGKTNLQYDEHSGVKFPTAEDLTGAAHAISRLQAIYKLDEEEMAEGIINGIAYSTPMSAGECFDLGRILFTHSDYYGALAWTVQALRKYRDNQGGIDQHLYKEDEIKTYMKNAENYLGFYERLWMRANEISKIDPKQERAAVRNLPHYGDQHDIENIFQLNIQSPGLEDKKHLKMLHDKWKRWEKYTSLCRGEKNIVPQVASKLKCFYLTKKDQFLRLAPIKTEQLYIEPNVFMFYDVINDVEIENIKSLAKSRFTHITVSKGHKKYNRKSARFKGEEVAPILHRLSEFTGLTVRYDSKLQVFRYQTGEYCDWKYSNDSSASRFNSTTKGVIATVMFYMSKVEQGGATVFTELDLTVYPVKDAALVWMNQDASGEALDTISLDCPVLQGTRWVSTKRIPLYAQTLLCPLKSEEKTKL